jgi:multiple sugar transport system substrate-binding protein
MADEATRRTPCHFCNASAPWAASTPGEQGPPNGPDTLRVLTRDTSAIGGPALRHGASFEAATGTRVTVTRIPFDALYQRIMLGFVTAEPPYRCPVDPLGLAARLRPLSRPGAGADPEEPPVRGHPSGLSRRLDALGGPVDGPDRRRGPPPRCLSPRPVRGPGDGPRLPRRTAAPWSRPAPGRSTRDLAAFFSGRAGPHGTPLAGTLEAYARGGQRIWYLFSHAAAYASHPITRAQCSSTPIP